METGGRVGEIGGEDDRLVSSLTGDCDFLLRLISSLEHNKYENFAELLLYFMYN